MVWNENLKINQENKIPCSEECFFEYENIWKDSILIRFDPLNVDIINLYALLQSYLWNNDLRVIGIYSGFYERDEGFKILHYSNIFVVKRMNLLFFSVWWEEVLQHDRLYIQNEKKEMYGIILRFSESSVVDFFNKNSLIKDDLIKIRPIYPWKESIERYLLLSSTQY